MADTINHRVAISRKIANMSQQEAAERLGMKCSTYSQMERKGKISGDRLVEISKIFNVSLTYLLEGKETDTTPLPPPPEKPIDEKLQTPVTPPVPDSPIMTLTRREQNIITIIRNLPKEEREELMKYIQDNYYWKK